jgi:hypothetical protein
MIQMTQVVRYCPDCRSDRPFEQHHPQAGGCPDSPDGLCPEWACTACGAALFIGLASHAGYSGRAPALRDRVA